MVKVNNSSPNILLADCWPFVGLQTANSQLKDGPTVRQQTIWELFFTFTEIIILVISAFSFCNIIKQKLTEPFQYSIPLKLLYFMYMCDILVWTEGIKKVTLTQFYLLDELTNYSLKTGQGKFETYICFTGEFLLVNKPISHQIHKLMSSPCAHKVWSKCDH